MKVQLSKGAKACVILGATAALALAWIVVGESRQVRSRTVSARESGSGENADAQGMVRLSASTAAPAGAASQGVSGASAQTRYLQSCATCHGQQGQGMPHQGPDLRNSSFVARQTDEQLIAFVRAGRLPTDPNSVMRLYMPPLGGNYSLKQQDLTQIVAYLRTLQAGAGPIADNRRLGQNPGGALPSR